MEALKTLIGSLTEPGGILRVRAVLAVLFAGGALYLWVTEGEVPQGLQEVLTVTVGWYFISRAS